VFPPQAKFKWGYISCSLGEDQGAKCKPQKTRKGKNGEQVKTSNTKEKEQSHHTHYHSRTQLKMAKFVAYPFFIC
jgi:hypothetical protein